MKSLLIGLLVLGSLSTFADEGSYKDRLVSGSFTVEVESNGKYLDLGIVMDPECKKPVKIQMLNDRKSSLDFTTELFQKTNLVYVKHNVLPGNGKMSAQLWKDQALAVAMLPIKGQIKSEIHITSCGESVKVQADHNYIVFKNNSL